MATQSLIQMMCHEMLVLEERELVSLEVKMKWRERKRVLQGDRRTGREHLDEKRVCGFLCLHVHMCSCLHEIEHNRE